MSKCEYYQELISRMMDEELSASESSALAEHLKDCPECAFMSEAFISLSDSISADMEDAPESLHYNVMAEIRRQEIIKKNRKSARLKKTLAAAACFALVVALGAGVMPKLKMASSAVSHDASEAAPMEATAPEFFRAQPETYAIEEDATVIEEAAPEAPEAHAVATSEDMGGTDIEVVSVAPMNAAKSDYRFSDEIMNELMQLLAGEVCDAESINGSDPMFTVSSDSFSISVYYIENTLYFADNLNSVVYKSVCVLSDFEYFISGF